MRCRQCGFILGQGVHVCSQCGEETAADQQCGRDAILTAVEDMLRQHDTLRTVKGKKSDLEIESLLGEADWGLGDKKLEYTAYLLLQDEEKVVVFWEMVKETGSELGFIGGFAAGKFGPDGSEIVNELLYDSDEKLRSYQLEYGRIRSEIKSIAEQCGWEFKTALFKRKAMYQGVRE